MNEALEIISTFVEQNHTTFFPTARRGNTGVGHTLEVLLGKGEDNLKVADILDTELKASLGRGSKRIRLTTMACGGENSLLSDFGVSNRAGTGHQFYPLMSIGSPKTFGRSTIDLITDHDRLIIRADQNERGSWHFDTVASVVSNKLKNIAVVSADKKTIDDIDHYCYHSIDFYEGLCVPAFIRAIEQAVIKVEFRISGNHDHGTSFNTTTKAMKNIWARHQRLTFQ